MSSATAPAPALATSTTSNHRKSSTSRVGSTKILVFATMTILAIVSSMFIGEAMAGGKGGKGKGEDIILYRGNIIMRGGKKGGNIVLANQQPNEEVEIIPSFFGMGGMGGFGA